MPVTKVDFETNYAQARPVGPPPPMADKWGFDSIAINPDGGSIEAVLVASLSQPDVNGQPQPAQRIATFTVTASVDEIAAVIGEPAYAGLMTQLKSTLHLIAQAHGQEPV